MSNFLEGLRILWDYYFLTSIVVAIVLIITYVVCAIHDNNYHDVEDTLSEAFFGLIAGMFGLGWILIVFAIPFIIVFLMLILGKRIFYTKDGSYFTRRRNLLKENFIYSFFQKDHRKGEDTF